MTSRKLQIRLTEEQRRSWGEAADFRGVSLSKWIRAVLDHVAKTTLEERDGRPVQKHE